MTFEEYAATRPAYSDTLPTGNDFVAALKYDCHAQYHASGAVRTKSPQDRVIHLDYQKQYQDARDAALLQLALKALRR